MKQTVLLWRLLNACLSSKVRSTPLSYKGIRLLLAIVFLGVFAENGWAQKISGGAADNTGRAMNIYTLSSGGNPGAGTTPFIPTNKFGSVGQPAAIVFNPAIPNPNHNSSGVLTNPTAAEVAGTVLAAEPTAQPTGLNFSSPSQTSYTISFTAASPAPTGGYLVLRKENSAITASPTDSNLPSVNTSLGDALVVSVGSSISIAQSPLTPGTTYFYRIFSYNGSGSTTNYLSTSPLSGSSLAAIPTGQSSGLSFSNVAANSLTVSFTAAPGADGYVVLRKSSSAPSSVPTIATTYPLGTLGDATVVYVGAATTFNDASLTPGTEYYYVVIPFSGIGIQTNYLTTGLLPKSTLSVAPTAQPTALVFSSVTSTTLTGSFTAAAGADGYLVLRKSGSAPVSVPANANVYALGATLGDATVVHAGSASTFNEASLAAGTDYYYKVFAYKGAGIGTNYLTTTPLSGNQVMESVAPTALTFSGFTSSSLNASFTAAANATGYLAIRRLGASPTGVPVDGTSYTVGATLGDGVVAFIGTGTSFSDSGLTGGTLYHYDIYSYTGATGFNYVSGTPLEGSATTLSAIPTAQPTALVFSNPQPAQLTLAWTAASPAVTGYIVLRKIDTDPTGVPVGGTAYVAGAALGDATVVYAGANTTFTDLSLAAETLYFYQVMAYNGAGAIINYLTASPLSGNRSTLATQPSAQPYNIQFDLVTTTSLRLTFINSPTTPFPNGYIILRKAGSAPISVPVDGTTYLVGSALGDATVVSIGNVISIDEIGLTAGTTYHYLIFAFNGGAGSYNFLTTGPLLGSRQTLSADTSPPSVSSTTVATISSGAELLLKARAIESGTGSVASVTVEYRSIAAGTTFTSAPMTLASGSNSLDGIWEFTVPATQIGELGLEFKFTATNSAGLTGVASGATTVNFTTSQSFPLLSFGSDVSNYRIISVPLVLKDKTVSDVFADDLGAYNNELWRMYRYEGGSTNELNGSSTIELGKGYWLISKDSKPIDIGEGTTSAATSTTPFKIDLVTGWNQIGNPYMFNVLWSDVATASGGASLTLRTYNGNFANATRLNKFEGGFVQVGAATSLTFPVAKNPAAGRSEEITEKRKTNALDNEDWEVRFNVSNGNRGNEFGGVGMSPQAKEGYDEYDDFTLPRFLDYVELKHPKKAYGMTYTKDIVPTVENFQWEFTIESNVEGTTSVAWDNSYFGKNDKHLVLWDVEEKRSVDMRETNQYLFKGKKEKAFQVFFGNKEYVQRKTELKHLLIHSISPNPTDGETKISFSLSGAEESFVEVKVLNLLGQSVSTVYEGKLAGGFHQLTWSGRDNQGNKPAQGVYLVEITQGKERGSKRLIVK